MTILGAKYKDKITKFEGIATGHAEYISGCSQVLLAAEIGKKGERVSEWFDVQRLERVGKSLIELDNGETPGCDQPAPKR